VQEEDMNLGIRGPRQLAGVARGDLWLLQYDMKKRRWWEPSPSSWRCPAVSHKSLV